jgi:hypothetical protein
MKSKKVPVAFLNKAFSNIYRIPFEMTLVGGYMLVYLLIVTAFYPGFMSFDSINQYSQLQGIIPLNDWHPPVMALLWKLLIAITGLTASLLIFTVGVFVLSSLLLSLYFYKITANKFLGLIPMAFLLSPSMLTFLGVLWKDVLLAAFFMLGATLLLIGSGTHKQWQMKRSYRNTLLTAGVFALLFGSTFRHGVWPAFIPMLVYAAWKLQLGTRTRLLVAISFIMMAAVIPVTVSRVFSVQDGKASIVIMVDDLISIASESNIKNSKLSEESKEYLINVKNRCTANGVRAYAAFLCDDTHTGFSSTVQSEFENTQEFWIDSIKQEPLDYIIHRIKIFIDFLNPSYIFAWQERIDPNQFNIVALDTPATYIVEDYVKFFINDWPSFFKPYFWLLVSTVVAIATLRARKRMHYFANIITVYLTSILLLLSFIPAAIVSDYRMTYTFTAASLYMLMLFIVDTYSNRPRQNNKKTKNRK